MSKEHFEEQLDILKTVCIEIFNSLTDYSKLEVESWLDSYLNKNEYIKATPTFNRLYRS
jgi:hypothetical protein